MLVTMKKYPGRRGREKDWLIVARLPIGETVRKRERERGSEARARGLMQWALRLMQSWCGLVRRKKEKRRNGSRRR